VLKIEGDYIAEVMKLMEFGQSKEDPLIQIVRTHQHHTDSTLLEIVQKFTKPFQHETKKEKV